LDNLTKNQINKLSDIHNYTDGHAYRRWSIAEENIINNSAKLFKSVDRKNQRSIEEKYICEFFKLSYQTLNLNNLEFYMCFTASMALEVVGNYLRLKNLTVGLIEPCFDNLADILKRHHVPMKTFPDELLEGSTQELKEFLSTFKVDVIFLVTPNNPTGKSITKNNFELLVDFCKVNKVTLILDSTFRFFLPSTEVFDQYKILDKYDIDFMVIEDTGKTWPTLEIKAPFFCVSHRLIEPIYDIYSDFLLHISPFAIALMTEFIKISQIDDCGYIKDIIAKNRASLNASVRGTYLKPVESPFMSVSWLKITNGAKSKDVVDYLAEHNVYILPGNQFFWSNQTRGDEYVRISLNRDVEEFEVFCHLLNKIILKRIL